jgi:hypothetical protein
MIDYSIDAWTKVGSGKFQEKSVYWSVFDHVTNTHTKFDLKLDAVIFNRTLQHSAVSFHWYEKEFARLNLTTEPTDSLQELCKKRAQELRNTYKHLRLFYSGGVDSHTALMSFVDNGIHLDEIIMHRLPDFNKSDIMDSTVRDFALSSSQTIRNIKHRIPNTKITIVTSTIDEINARFNVPSDPYDITFLHVPDGVVGMLISTTSNAYCKVIQSSEHDDWCDIYGGSKVKILKKNNKWYFYFVDSAMNESVLSNRTEDFFISRTIPELYLKTVHNVKNYCTTINMPDSKINSFHEGDNLVELNRAMGRLEVPLVAQLKLYSSNEDESVWKDKFISGELNRMFYKNVITTPEGQRWYSAHVKIQQMLMEAYPWYWNTDSSGVPSSTLGAKGYLSKFYCITDGTIHNTWPT